MKIIWTNKAVTNLKDIKEYIAHDSVYYAKVFSSKIITYIKKLVHLPRLGRVVPELGREDIRELVYQSYRIIYRVNTDSNNITILLIIHGARDSSKTIGDLSAD